MLEGFTRRLVPLLQLTRMALVFTAIADSYATALMLRHWTGYIHNIDDDLPDLHQDPRKGALMLTLAAISIGLYGFGMSLNDIADRRRDRQIAAHRPLPSGRIGVFTAHALMLVLVFGALGAAAFYALNAGEIVPPGNGFGPRQLPDWRCLFFAVFVAALISFYDLAGKFLVAPGLIALGLIRFFHALIPGPMVPVVWHPLFLLNHVTILSTVCYHLEEKRPPLTRTHWWMVLGGLGLIDAGVIGLLAWRRGWSQIVLVDDPMMPWPLIPPIATVFVFLAVAWYICRRAKTRPEAGRTLMLFGLLWLIVYDAAFVGSYAGWLDGVLLLMLFPLAYFSVQLMRWWSQILSLGQKPTFKRARA